MLKSRLQSNTLLPQTYIKMVSHIHISHTNTYSNVAMTLKNGNRKEKKTNVFLDHPPFY